jgi:hypothetical protein
MSGLDTAPASESGLRPPPDGVSQHVSGANHPLLPNVPNIPTTYGNEFVEADRKAEALRNVRRDELVLLEEIKAERDPHIERYGYNNSRQRASSWWRSKR